MSWVLEHRVTCDQCGTREEEWDPEKGGDVNAYYAKVYLDPGCKLIRDAYDAEYENRKDSDGKADMNGVKVKLVPKEQRMKEVAQRRRKAMADRGELPEKQRIPFYPFP